MFAAKNVLLTANQKSPISITLASTSGTNGSLSLNCQSNTTVISMLVGYQSSDISARIQSATGISPFNQIRSESADNSSSNTAVKLFQGTRATAGLCTISPDFFDTNYMATAAVGISGHQNISQGATASLSVGTTQYSITPPSGGFAVVFLGLQWGSYDATVISGSPTLQSVFADNRSGYTGAYIAVASAPTTLTINPAIRVGRSPGLLMQYNVT